jgi:hypothetical protein
MRALFLEPGFREWVRNWDAITAMMVSWLRFLVAEEQSSDLELQSLIGELSSASQRFRTLWACQDVQQKTSGPVLLDHPQVGPLELRYRAFLLPDTRQALVVYYAEPGSLSEERLRLLSSLTYPPT